MYLTENWRLKGQRYTLKGTRTTDTQTLTFPPRYVEPRPVQAYDFTGNDPEKKRQAAYALEAVK